jgi:hypothetical protein
MVVIDKAAVYFGIGALKSKPGIYHLFAQWLYEFELTY